MSFWERVLSPQTARFVLALLALFAAAGGAFWFISGKSVPDAKDAVIFALGQLFALAAIAFNYYFGSTARNDERPVETKVVNEPQDPVPIEPSGSSDGRPSSEG